MEAVDKIAIELSVLLSYFPEITEFDIIQIIGVDELSFLLNMNREVFGTADGLLDAIENRLGEIWGV